MAWSRYRRKGQSTKMGNETSLCQLGHSHGSKLESAVCQILMLRMKAGEIRSIQVQDHLYLTRARIGYIPDFRCESETGEVFWVEAKGYANDRWPIKKKLWKFYGPGRLEIWNGTHRNPYLDETIIPVISEENEGEAAALEASAFYQKQGKKK